MARTLIAYKATTKLITSLPMSFMVRKYHVVELKVDTYLSMWKLSVTRAREPTT